VAVHEAALRLPLPVRVKLNTGATVTASLMVAEIACVWLA
jgi:hypothetical protein